MVVILHGGESATSILLSADICWAIKMIDCHRSQLHMASLYIDFLSLEPLRSCCHSKTDTARRSFTPLVLFVSKLMTVPFQIGDGSCWSWRL